MDNQTLASFVNAYLNGAKKQIETLQKERANLPNNVTWQAYNENMAHYFKGEIEALKTVLYLIDR